MFNFKFIFSDLFPRRWFYPLLSLVVAVSVLVATPHPTPAVPWRDLLLRGVQVIQLSNISDRQEVQIGQQINAGLVGQEFRLYTNRQVNAYVDEVGQRIAAASDRPGIPYTFQVVQDNNVNAFATMGGYVYVTTGLLRTAENEAELASVLAHEVGHIASRHMVEQMRQTAISRGLASAAGLNGSTAVQLGLQLALDRPRSRKDELEADRRALQTITKAGYAQSAIVSFMEKLLEQGGSPPSFLSTHPATQDRIAALEKELDPTRATVGEGLNQASYRANIRPLVPVSRRS
ncbi:MAG TPA: M48 family metallopeptidase [Leptolyngbyaceae cyanobacterium]